MDEPVAMICREDRGGNEGGATFWFTRLPDGYLIGCGYQAGARERALAIAEAINRSDWPRILEAQEADALPY